MAYDFLPAQNLGIIFIAIANRRNIQVVAMTAVIAVETLVVVSLTQR